jgi:hypothetical protein
MVLHAALQRREQVFEFSFDGGLRSNVVVTIGIKTYWRINRSMIAMYKRLPIAIVAVVAIATKQTRSTTYPNL